MTLLVAFDVLFLVLVFAKWLGEAECDRHGHAWVLRIEPHRLFLQCTVCPKRTPGWDLT